MMDRFELACIVTKQERRTRIISPARLRYCYLGAGRIDALVTW